MRKQVMSVESVRGTPEFSDGLDELDVAGAATALISSEAADHPIEHAFDGSRGPGSSRWVAGTDGEQTLILKFDRPQSILQITLEIEETEVSRAQELNLAFSTDGGRTFRELVRQEYNFSPPHTTFEREQWQVTAREATDLRLVIKPDKGSRPCRAGLTAMILHVRRE